MPLPTRAKITASAKENDIVTTLQLEPEAALPSSPYPGQFFMLWLPGFDEKPYSAAGVSPISISVGARGPFSKRLAGLKKGDSLWLRGPYGKGFELKGKRILLIGGGYGFAPLRFLASEAKKKGISATAICGARSASLLMKPAACKTVFTTDDGSQGMKGNVLAAAEELFKKEKFDAVYTCGPERMMGSVARLAKENGADCRLLLERYMKCGIGVCGHCCCGEKLVCFDGPCFGPEILENPDFEKFRRDKCGKRVPL
ncbi:MAG: dihydroorotate dehydrogenase electron transfer subunit [Candidatus Micrarchaeia archaeon]